MSEKFIFLTGGAKRIGKATCKHFHDEGFNIIFHYNSSKTEAEEIFEELNSKRKNSCHILQANFDDESSADILQEGISKITKDSSISAIKKSDIILFVIDSRNSLTPDDYSLASLVRKSGKKVILIANKSEGASIKQGEIDSYSLGFGDPLSVSSEHNLGISELQNQIVDNSSQKMEFINDKDNRKKLAILGRPNSGKSTLINMLVGEERQIVGPEAGLTRDSIPLFFEMNSVNYQIWDTAGIRKKSKISEHAEKLSVMS